MLIYVYIGLSPIGCSLLASRVHQISNRHSFFFSTRHPNPNLSMFDKNGRFYIIHGICFFRRHRIDVESKDIQNGG